MVRRVAASPLLLGGAAVSVLGGVVADVALGEHPTHSVVLGIVALVVAALHRRLASGAVSALPAVAGALSAQPVLHFTAESARLQVLPHHQGLLSHLVVHEAPMAMVQVAAPVLVLLVVTTVAHLVCLMVNIVRRPLAPPPTPIPVTSLIVTGVRTDARGSLLRWCGWTLLAGRRGPPSVLVHVAS